MTRPAKTAKSARDRVTGRAAGWAPAWLAGLEPEPEPGPGPGPEVVEVRQPQPGPAAGGLPWRETVSGWPNAWRERWGLRANELQESGRGWRDAERLAFDEMTRG